MVTKIRRRRPARVSRGGGNEERRGRRRRGEARVEAGAGLKIVQRGGGPRIKKKTHLLLTRGPGKGEAAQLATVADAHWVVSHAVMQSNPLTAASRNAFLNCSMVSSSWFS